MMSAMASYDNGTTQNASVYELWSSENTSVATVTNGFQAGQVTAVSAGSTNIEAVSHHSVMDVVCAPQTCSSFSFTVRAQINAQAPTADRIVSTLASFAGPPTCPAGQSGGIDKSRRSSRIRTARTLFWAVRN